MFRPFLQRSLIMPMHHITTPPPDFRTFLRPCFVCAWDTFFSLCIAQQHYRHIMGWNSFRSRIHISIWQQLKDKMALQKILDPKVQSSCAVEFYRGEKETVCSCLWQPKSIDWPNLIFVDSFSCHMLHSRCFSFPSFSSTSLNSILIS